MPGGRPTYVFLGTPHAAAVVLDHLVAHGVQIAHVITQPDAKRGRGSALSPSPVKQVAMRLGIEVSHDLAWVNENASKGLMGLVVAYGRIIPADLLKVVPMVNVHFSLLPRWRGAAPVERALLAGDHTTGVCVMKIEPSLDTGPVYARSELPITDDSTSESLTEDLANLGGQLLLECLGRGLGDPEPQVGEATHAAKITRDELRINWANSAVSIHRQIRAVRAYTETGGIRLRIIAAEVSDSHTLGRPGSVTGDAIVTTGEGSLRLLRVKPEGRAEMDASAWLRGRPSGETPLFD